MWLASRASCRFQSSREIGFIRGLGRRYPLLNYCHLPGCGLYLKGSFPPPIHRVWISFTVLEEICRSEKHAVSCCHVQRCAHVEVSSIWAADQKSRSHISPARLMQQNQGMQQWQELAHLTPLSTSMPRRRISPALAKEIIFIAASPSFP